MEIRLNCEKTNENPKAFTENALQYFNEDYTTLFEVLNFQTEIENYCDSFLNDGAPTIQKVNIILGNVNVLKDIYRLLSVFLTCPPYYALVNDGRNDHLKTWIDYLKNEKKKCGKLINTFYKYIAKNKYYFPDMPDYRLGDETYYKSNLSEQYKAAKGLTDDDIVDDRTINKWARDRINAGMGKRVINHIRLFGDIKPAELHKGLSDSVFKLCHDELPSRFKNSPIITPYYNYISSIDNVIKGKVSYEHGLIVDNHYDVKDFPQDVDTLVLYNPFDEEEMQTVLKAANDYNVVFSIFGDEADIDYANKQQTYNNMYHALESKLGCEPKEEHEYSGSSYVKSLFSQKNPK